jgi:hypothetical protein
VPGEGLSAHHFFLCGMEQRYLFYEFFKQEQFIYLLYLYGKFVFIKKILFLCIFEKSFTCIYIIKFTLIFFIVYIIRIV